LPASCTGMVSVCSAAGLTSFTTDPPMGFAER